jgi:arogenate dehydrogenase (NADP+)
VNGNQMSNNKAQLGKLEELKQREAELSALLADVRLQKLTELRSRPLTIGIVGFGRFGQFIAKTFTKYGRVVVTSRSDYTALATSMGVTYVPLSDTDAFMDENLDVIVFAVSILSFKSMLQSFVTAIEKYTQKNRDDLSSSHAAPLLVDVLSVKEHARNTMLDLLPKECDILCTHPMFGPDSGKDGWHGLTFVYEKTRIDKILLDQTKQKRERNDDEHFVDGGGRVHSVHEDSEAHVEGMDRIERFLSIWEEEGCRMVPMSCHEHDAYAANSQFITHLVGRVLGSQGLAETPIDTSGFESVLKLVGSTTADSFDLFYGLYKFNQNSMDTIKNLQAALNDVVQNLKIMEEEEQVSQATAEETKEKSSAERQS